MGGLPLSFIYTYKDIPVGTRPGPESAVKHDNTCHHVFIAYSTAASSTLSRSNATFRVQKRSFSVFDTVLRFDHAIARQLTKTRDR